LGQFILKNMLSRSILILTIFFCISCNDSRNTGESSLHVKGDSSILEEPDTNNINKSIKKHEGESLNGDEIISEKNGFKILFNQNTRLVKLLFKDSIHVMGNLFNTLGYPPNVEFVDIQKNQGILIVSLIEQLGMVEYQLNLFEFDFKKNALYKQCSFSNIATHNTEMDTLANITHYDYRIEGNQFIINEYYPFKHDKDSSSYTKKTKSCNLK